MTNEITCNFIDMSNRFNNVIDRYLAGEVSREEARKEVNEIFKAFTVTDIVKFCRVGTRLSDFRSLFLNDESKVSRALRFLENYGW